MSKNILGEAIGRRRFLQSSLGGATAAAAMTGFVAPLSAAEAKELRILFPGGTWKDWFEKTFVAPFADSHGTKIVWKTGLGFEPLVIAQRTRPQWDLIHLSQNKASQLGAMNAIIEFKKTAFPTSLRSTPPSATRISSARCIRRMA
jgi:spermidine/putrescine-binding protein